ncbi:unnamed protein product, partial [Mesorhabditis spiculigera]
MVRHNPGPLGQKNKKHKTGGHKTKGVLKKEARGRTVSRSSVAGSAHSTLSRQTRKCQASQRRRLKNEADSIAKESLGKENKPPILVAIVPLSGAPSGKELVEQLASCDSTIIRSNTPVAQYFTLPRFKTRIGFVTPNPNDIEAVLDSLKVADVVCFVWQVNHELTSQKELLLSLLLAHGMPSPICLVNGMGQISSAKQRDLAWTNLKKTINRFSLPTDKLLKADSANDGLKLLRTFNDGKKKKLLMQQRHPHMLVEKLDAADEDTSKGTCTLLATGYIRGPSMNVNHLVYLPGLGEFQLSKIFAHEDPNPVRERQREWNPAAGNLAAEASPSIQESLQSEIVPNEMDGEQILIDQDLKKDEKHLFVAPEKKKMPKGTSSYQAAWIIPDDEEGEGEGDEEEEEDGEDEEDTEGSSDEGEGEEIEPEEAEEENDQVMDEDARTEAADTEFGDIMDDEVDMDEVAEFNAERQNEQWPDEIDTPMDIPARVRFQKYRALKSFRESPWDVNENLPYNYARIFKFQNFNRTKKLVLKKMGEETADCVSSGTFVTLFIKDVPASYLASIRPDSLLVLYALLPHEQKMSVVNMAVKKHPTCKTPILNNGTLTFHVGFRKFESQALFSQHHLSDKVKMERYLPSTGPCVVSVFAPVIFPPATVLIFQKLPNDTQQLVATGSLLDNNPDRIVLKRVVLSGHPFKINRRSAIVRYLFFNRDDVEWFKPVELHTPSGRRGHIRMAIGTHGHFKCRFDQQLDAQDTVMMNLYKRVYPKWSYTSHITKLPTVLLNQEEGPLNGGQARDEMEE